MTNWMISDSTTGAWLALVPAEDATAALASASQYAWVARRSAYELSVARFER
ncbi:hypothetical protein PBI_SARFIRE_96 [Mycobacterium phage SarFire]|uniref:hypothetical protein n=1 Tax=Mycobacterium phage SarFire TaxID=1340827 RepID=UPI00038989EA|nr:hypothetical protein P765_gp96 [Mycobacterium phage SarFire]AGT20627.1 hypothetical protein PBI_SARFIRE_96 [Mycobacterium phage SarFire]AJA43671.1 hypothetical protein PBI_THOR_96 [Mycobacterium phage Thor]